MLIYEISTNITKMEFIPTDPVELATYESLWKYADPEDVGKIGGMHAVNVLKRSGLPNPRLREIWSLSTTDPFMSKPQFFLALRLISMLQNGVTVLSPGWIHISQK